MADFKRSIVEGIFLWVVQNNALTINQQVLSAAVRIASLWGKFYKLALLLCSLTVGSSINHAQQTACIICTIHNFLIIHFHFITKISGAHVLSILITTLNHLICNFFEWGLATATEMSLQIATVIWFMLKTKKHHRSCFLEGGSGERRFKETLTNIKVENS